MIDKALRTFINESAAQLDKQKSAYEKLLTKVLIELAKRIDCKGPTASAKWMREDVLDNAPENEKEWEDCLTEIVESTRAIWRKEEVREKIEELQKEMDRLNSQ